MKLPHFAKWARWTLYGVLGLAAAAVFFIGVLRYIYLLPINQSRPVSFLRGFVVVDVPNTWTVTHEPPEVFVLRHHVLDATLRLQMQSLSAGPPGSSVVDFLKTRVEGSSIDSLDERRAISTERIVSSGRPWSLDERYHVAYAHADGSLWHLAATFETASGLEYAPSIRADAEFFRDSIRMASIATDSEVAQKIYDEWAPARISMEEAEADFDVSINAFLLSGVVFFIAWAIAYFVLERKLRLGKVGYTYVGQVTTLISLAGVLLAAWAIFSNRLEYRNRLAQVAAEMSAGNAAIHLHDEATTCPKGFTGEIRRYPLLDRSETVEIDCETLRPIAEAMAGHFAFARKQALQQGSFVDPRWRMGLPITMFYARGRQIIDRAQLTEAQYEALSNRYEFYAAPLNEALRIIQSQSEATAMSKVIRAMSGYWGIFVAVSLALGMVKLSGDRRFERDKEAKEANNQDKVAQPPPPAVPLAGAQQVKPAEVTMDTKPIARTE